MKEYYYADSQDEMLNEGDPVWLYNPTRKGLIPKLTRPRPWQGPYIIVKRINDLVYCIQLGPKCKPKVVHKNQLWRYTGNNVPSWNFNGTGNHNAEVVPCETNMDTVKMSEASQSRPVLPNKSNSNQTLATSKQKRPNLETPPQKQSSNGLRKSSRLRQASTRYGQ